MARVPRANTFEPESITAEANNGTDWTAIGLHGRLVPRSFTVSARTIMPAAAIVLHCAVAENGNINVQTATIMPTGNNPSVTTSVLRQVLVDHLVRAAVDRISRRVDMPGSPVNPLPHYVRAGRDSRIREAAQAYRNALAQNSPAPVYEVGLSLGYSHSQASRYVRDAFAAGLLDDVPRPKPGLRVRSGVQVR